MNIPKLRFNEFNEEWEQKKLGELLSIGSGRDYKHLSKGNIPVFGTGGYMTSVDSYLFDGESVCIGRKGTINKPLYLNEKFWTVDTLFFTHSFKKVLPKFIYNVFEQINWLQYNEASGVPSLSKSTIEQIPINIPSLPEQEKIAEFLSSVDAKLNLLKKKKELLEQYKKGVMQNIFSQKLRFKDQNGQEFPKWEEKKLDSIMVERNIQEQKSEKHPLMAFIAYKGVTPKGDKYNREFLISDTENKKYKKTELGDFIYSSNNLETGSIGLNNYGSASISPVYSIFQITEECSKKFIGNYFTRKEFINKMIKYRQGVVYGQWRIHESAFLNIKEYLPTLPEQEKIADFLSGIDSKLELVKNQIEKTELWKKGLLQKMFV